MPGGALTAVTVVTGGRRARSRRTTVTPLARGQKWQNSRRCAGATIAGRRNRRPDSRHVAPRRWIRPHFLVPPGRWFSGGS